MTMECLFEHHNTLGMGAEPTHVTVTHPHHPLNGQKLELVGVLRGPDSPLVVKMPDGSRARMQRDWTDYTSLAGDCDLTNITHLLSVESLREIIKIVGLTQVPKNVSK